MLLRFLNCGRRKFGTKFLSAHRFMGFAFTADSLSEIAPPFYFPLPTTRYDRRFSVAF